MRAILIAALLCITCPLAASSVSQAPQEAAAVKAAEHFLMLVDQGRYGESWDEAADLFVARVAKEEWRRTLAGVRAPFGALIKREVLSRQFTTSLPGVPGGEYVLILFATSFARKSDAVETVTTVLEDDGQWRVAGYFIK